MVFRKNSTRTRVAFEVGMVQLGGQALFLSAVDTQIGRDEPLADTASRASAKMADFLAILHPPSDPKIACPEPMTPARKKDFLSLRDFTRDELTSLLEHARRLKAGKGPGAPLRGKSWGDTWTAS